MGASFLEVLEARLDGALGSLSWWGQPAHLSRLLWLYDIRELVMQAADRSTQEELSGHSDTSTKKKQPSIPSLRAHFLSPSYPGTGLRSHSVGLSKRGGVASDV